MNAQGDRCAAELADAECDVLANACLVAVMATGPGAHVRAEAGLRAAARGNTPVVTSTGALIEGIRALEAERVAQLAPYAAVDREGGRVPGRRRNRRGGRGQPRLDRQLRGGTARPAQPSGADRAARPEPGRGLGGGVGLRTDAVAGRRPVSQDLTGLPTLSAATRDHPVPAGG